MLCISKLKGPGGRWWARSWACCVLCRAAVVRNGVRKESLTFPVLGILWRNGNRSFLWRTPSGSYVPHRLKACTSPDHCSVMKFTESDLTLRCRVHTLLKSAGAQPLAHRRPLLTGDKCGLPAAPVDDPFQKSGFLHESHDYLRP